jgi:ankyrin repeat protein
MLRRFSLAVLASGAFAVSVLAQQPAPPPADDAEALHKAAEDGDLAKVQALVDKGASVDAPSGPYRFTPLIGAAADGHLDVLTYLIQKGAKLDYADVQGSTPLLHACWNDKTDCALALIKAGAHVNYASNANRYPVMYAAMHGNDQIIAAIIANRGKLDANCNEGPAVTWAASADKLSTLKLLANGGAKLTLMPEGGRPDAYSILSRAAAVNDLSMVNFLLDRKVDVNTLDGDNGTALMAAASYGYTGIVDRLLEAGAAIDAQNNDGDTALMQCKGASTTQALLQHHANAELKNKKGQTALMLAALALNTDRVHALVDGGADINTADPRGETALTIAADTGGAEIVAFLKGKGAQRTDVHIIVKGDPDPSLTPAQAWALAVGAFYLQVNGMNPRTLGGGSDLRIDPKAMLKNDWSISSYADLVKELDDLRDRGHHAAFQAGGAKLDVMPEDQFNLLLSTQAAKSTEIMALRNSYRKWKERSGLAWDLCRSANIINSAYAAGLISRQEAWDRLLANAKTAQKNFSSWQELSDNFLDGREIWANTRAPRFEALATLLLNPSDPNSPWNQNPWTTDLTK